MKVCLSWCCSAVCAWETEGEAAVFVLSLERVEEFF